MMHDVMRVADDDPFVVVMIVWVGIMIIAVWVEWVCGRVRR